MFHDEENEMAILGACLRDYKNVIPNVIGFLSPLDFYNNFHQEIYGAVLSLFQQQKTVNPTTVMTVLRRDGKTYDLGLFTRLAENCFASAGAEDYARRIKDCAIRRNVMYAMSQILNMNQAQEPIEKVLSTANQKVNELIESTRGISKRTRYQLKETLSDYCDELAKTAPDGLSKKRQVQTGFNDFDVIFGGLRKGSLIYIGGRPSMGKSTIAIQMALNIALAGGTVFFCSFEIGKIELQTKLISLKTRILSRNIDIGPIEEWTMKEIMIGCEQLYPLKFFYTDTAMTTQEIMLETQQIRDTTGELTAVFIDRIEIIRDAPLYGENRNLQLSRISANLNQMAIELDIPVVCLVQLSRQSARRGSADSHRPILSDFRDSGSIEQDAKMAIMIHREEMYSRKAEYRDIAELIISKNMFGSTGILTIGFDSVIPAFYEKDRAYREEIKYESEWE